MGMRLAWGFALDAAANYRAGLEPTGINYAERDVLGPEGEAEASKEKENPNTDHKA